METRVFPTFLSVTSDGPCTWSLSKFKSSTRSPAAAAAVASSSLSTTGAEQQQQQRPLPDIACVADSGDDSSGYTLKLDSNGDIDREGLQRALRHWGFAIIQPDDRVGAAMQTTDDTVRRTLDAQGSVSPFDETVMTTLVQPWDRVVAQVTGGASTLFNPAMHKQLYAVRAGLRCTGPNMHTRHPMRVAPADAVAAAASSGTDVYNFYVYVGNNAAGGPRGGGLGFLPAYHDVSTQLLTAVAAVTRSKPGIDGHAIVFRAHARTAPLLQKFEEPEREERQARYEHLLKLVAGATPLLLYPSMVHGSLIVTLPTTVVRAPTSNEYELTANDDDVEDLLERHGGVCLDPTSMQPLPRYAAPATRGTAVLELGFVPMQALAQFRDAVQRFHKAHAGETFCAYLETLLATGGGGARGDDQPARKRSKKRQSQPKKSEKEKEEEEEEDEREDEENGAPQKKRARKVQQQQQQQEAEDEGEDEKELQSAKDKKRWDLLVRE